MLSICHDGNTDSENTSDFINKLVDQAQTTVKSSDSKYEIPDYSEEKKDKVASDHNSIDTTQLEQVGGNARDKEIKGNPDCGAATISAASSLKRLENTENYHKLDMFTKADEIMRDPVSSMDSLTTENCKELSNNKKRGYHTREIVETKREEVKGETSCEIGGLKLQCNKVCKLTCENTINCAFGGIAEDSVESDMKLDYTDGILTIGNSTRKFWRGICLTIDRPTSFNIRNLDLITEFRLIEVGFDDYIKLDLNGHKVYMGPEDGEILEVQNVEKQEDMWSWLHEPQKVWNGKQHVPCERDTHRQKYPNIDLKPYLKEGKNTIAMRVIVSGTGEGWLKIQAKQHCCDKWHEEWITSCEPIGGEIKFPTQVSN
ncbi:MAG: hypothetical protein RIT35_768, partial [Pseudomonadota bacterium]